MKFISIVNQKGGVAKTTSCFELSYVISHYTGKSVLMIDLDGQCNLTKICGAKNNEKATIYDALMGNISFAEAITNVRENLDIIAGNRKMLPQHFIGNDDMYLLQEALEIIKKVKDYDFIFCDCGPQASVLQTMALLASDYIIMAAKCETLAYDGALQLCSDINSLNRRMKGFNAKPLGILLACVESTNVAEANINKYKELSDVFGAPLFPIVKKGCVVDEAKEFGYAINEYKSSSQQARAYYEIAKEIIKRIEEGKK